jgi:O-acetyl-ADP-ribose deacetylase (regulator of RNase III)
MQLIGTVAQSFSISGRGVGVLFVASPDPIGHLSSFDVVVERPDGTSAVFAATREFARTLDAPHGEVVALMVIGAGVHDIPVGSVVSIPIGLAADFIRTAQSSAITT